MKSISALKKSIKEARDIYEEARVKWTKDPEVVRLRKKLKDAEIKAQKAGLSNREKARDDVIAAEKALRDFREAKEIEVPERISKIISQCLRGTDYGPKGLVVEWVSPKERFAIVVQPGHTFWANQMETSKYATAERTLLDVMWDDPDEQGSSLFRAVMVKKHEGRFVKAVKKEWLDYVDQEEAS